MTNHTTVIELTNATISSLSSQNYSLDVGLTAFVPLVAVLIIYLVAYFTKNFPAVMGSGLLLIALSFSNIPITNISQINIIAVLLLGVSIIYTGIFSVKRYMNKESENSKKVNNDATIKPNS